VTAPAVILSAAKDLLFAIALGPRWSPREFMLSVLVRSMRLSILPLFVGVFGFLVVLPLLDSFPAEVGIWLFDWIVVFSVPGLFISVMLGGNIHVGNIWVAALANSFVYFGLATLALKAWARWGAKRQSSTRSHHD